MVIKISKMAAILLPLSDDAPSKSYSLTFPLMMKKKRSLSSLLSTSSQDPNSCGSEATGHSSVLLIWSLLPKVLPAPEPRRSMYSRTALLLQVVRSATVVTNVGKRSVAFKVQVRRLDDHLVYETKLYLRPEVCRSLLTSQSAQCTTPPFRSSSERSVDRNGAPTTNGSTSTTASAATGAESTSPTKAKTVLDESAIGGGKTSPSRIPLDPSVSSLERNFITPGRAMADFMLKIEHLEGLKATKRRSPYINQPPITVYWRKDVEAKALEVWGSKDNLLKEILRQQLERKLLEQSNATIKRQLRSSRRESLYEQDQMQQKSASSGLLGHSGRVVLSAITINFTNFLMKFIAWYHTGSHSLFAECIHSLADTMNQVILAYGIHKSVQKANADHPYGYTNMKYVSSLISGVGIFCVGTGLSVYHGIVGLMSPSPLDSILWAFLSLAGSLMTEGATCIVAIASIRRGARESNMSVKDYILSGQDPSVNVVLLEDCAALLSILVTGSCIGLAAFTGSSVPDAVGSLLVGGILGAVASFIIHTNVTALVGRSISQEFLDKINYELESDVMIRGIHDVKGIDMGNSLIRYKAELDFDGRELTRLYLDHQDLKSMFDEVKGMKSIDEFETFLLKHSENIIDTMGGEIDRIEVKLRKKFPQIRHCDLEIL